MVVFIFLFFIFFNILAICFTFGDFYSTICVFKLKLLTAIETFMHLNK